MSAPTQLSWVNEEPQKAPKPRSSYTPRRPHTKSRTGCQNCKQRRLKCDETHPQCQNCLSRNLACNISPPPPPTTNDLPPPQNPQEDKATTRTQIQHLLETTPSPCHQMSLHPPFCPAPHPNFHLHLYDHFLSLPPSTLGSLTVQTLLQTHAPHLSLSAPYLLHALLAFSASHLSFLSPLEDFWDLAFKMHYQRSLTEYSAEIMRGLDENNGEAVVGCGHLHSMLAFRGLVNETVKGEGGEREEGEGRGGFGWLKTMRGVGTLWNTPSLKPLERKSIWHPVCAEARAREVVVCKHEDGSGDERERIARELHELCGVPHSSNTSTDISANPYRQPLSRLCVLLNLEKVGDEQIGIFISFIGLQPEHFSKLLDEGDARALLIICIWCALFGQVEQWWIVESAKKECRRLCGILEGSKDERVRELMRFPADVCGYAVGS